MIEVELALVLEMLDKAQDLPLLLFELELVLVLVVELVLVLVHALGVEVY